MIRLADKSDITDITKKLRSNPYMSIMYRAGVGKTYVCDDGTVLILNGTDLHISATKASAEIISFATLTAEHICRKTRSAKGFVFAEKLCNEEEDASVPDFEDCKQLYDVVTACNEGITQSFDEFYVGLRKMLDCGKRHATIIYKGDKAVSCAMTVFEGTGFAYIAGVATLEEYRGNGYASNAVSDLCKALYGKKAYVMFRPELEGFYSALGFEAVAKYIYEKVPRRGI